MKQLGTSDWFSCRMAASNLISVVLEKIEEDSLIQLFKELCNDDTPMVRRTCAECLKDFADYADKLMEQFRKLVSDNQDSVKQMALESCVNFCHGLQDGAFKEQMIPILDKASKEHSWRIRFSVAEILPGVAERFQSAEEIIPILTKILKDSEIEVRSNACSQLGKLSIWIQPDKIISDIVPLLPSLAEDNSQYVKIALSESLCDLGARLKAEEAVNHVLPILGTMIKDESADVRMELVKHIGKLN